MEVYGNNGILSPKEAALLGLPTERTTFPLSSAPDLQARAMDRLLLADINNELQTNAAFGTPNNPNDDHVRYMSRDAILIGFLAYELTRIIELRN
jgi:hypothetical protein